MSFMDQIDKFLRKLGKKHSKLIKIILLDIVNFNLNLYDIKKIKGSQNLYRIRSGKIRIIFKKIEDKNIPIYIDYRNSIYTKVS